MPFGWIWSPGTDSPWSAYITVLPARRAGLRQEVHEGDELGAGVAGEAASFQSEGLWLGTAVGIGGVSYGVFFFSCGFSRSCRSEFPSGAVWACAVQSLSCFIR